MIEDPYRYRQRDIDAATAAAQERIAKLEAENNSLRSRLARSNADCPYCGLPQTDMAKCAHGFPGCGRADDLMADPSFFELE